MIGLDEEGPMIIVLRPAYGRRYESYDALLVDWLGGREFKVHNGPYCSIRNLALIRERGYTVITFVWMNLINTIHQKDLSIHHDTQH